MSASPHDDEWTMATWSQHAILIRDFDLKFNEERDRRYAEVAVEKEKALKIKEVADLAALQLAREIQSYKDEKANELRSQIERERGSYATQQDLTGSSEKLEAIIKPLVEFMASQQGRQSGIGISAGVFIGSLTAVATVLTIVITIAAFLVK